MTAGPGAAAGPRRPDRLLTPGEVASIFRVDPKTVTRWAAAGRLSSIRTPGGHRRFRESEVQALLRGTTGSSTMGDQQHADARTGRGAAGDAGRR